MTTQPDRLMAGEKLRQAINAEIFHAVLAVPENPHERDCAQIADETTSTIMALLPQSSPGEDRERIDLPRDHIGTWVPEEAVAHDEDGGGSVDFTGGFYIENNDPGRTVRFINLRNPRVAKFVAAAVNAAISTPPREQEQK